jgi:glycosyltransferase involved in cell wall biosynthesis
MWLDMKIYYFSIYDVLRARTNQISDIRLCEGLAQAGCEVEMITPYVYRHDNIEKKEVFDVYGVETPFRLSILKTPFIDDMPPVVMLPLLLLYVAFSCVRIWLVNATRLSEVVIMSRSTDMLIPALLLKKALFMRGAPLVVSWAHEVIFRRRYVWVYRAADAVVGTNSAITEDLHRELDINISRLAITLNPISERQLSNRISREDARARLNLSFAEPLIVYTGKLYIGQKEAEYILEAARRLPEYQFLLTGGKQHVVKHYQDYCKHRGIQNVILVGFLKNYDEVQYYQFAADVLVSYYTSADHMTRYNLPNKMCEYMLARNPVVTCDFPATRDVLNPDNAIFVAAESADALAHGIRLAIEDRTLAKNVAERAFMDVQKMTFRVRAEKLVQFFRDLIRVPAPSKS